MNELSFDLSNGTLYVRDCCGASEWHSVGNVTLDTNTVPFLDLVQPVTINTATPYIDWNSPITLTSTPFPTESVGWVFHGTPGGYEIIHDEESENNTLEVSDELLEALTEYANAEEENGKKEEN